MWVYLRFTLSYRDVEDLLAERGRPMIWAHRMTFTESAGRVVLGFQIGRVMSGPRSRGTDSSWTLCWSGQDSNFESLHGKLAEPRIKTRAVGPSVPSTQGFVLIEIPVNPNQQTFLDVVGKYSARPSTGEVSSFDVVVYSPREVTR